MNYLTLAEYKAAPTAVDVSNLTSGGVSDAQNTELYRRIGVASGWADNFTNNPLGAAARTATATVRVGRRGELNLHPGPTPLVALTALSTGPAANQLTAVSDLSGVWISEDSFIVPSWTGAGPFSVPIQFGASWPGVPMMARYTYTSGYPCTTLAATATTAATTLTLTSTVGIVAGTVLTIVDGASTEDVTVLAVTDATHVSLVAATTATHTFVDTRLNAIGVHAMPGDVKDAIVLITTAFIRARGNDGLVMNQSMTPGPTPGMSPITSADLKLAREILSGYRRIR